MPFQLVKLLDTPVVISGNVTLTGGVAMAATGNTSGTMATVSDGTFFLAGGNNITLSQNSNTLTIVGGAGGIGSLYAGSNVSLSTNGNSTTVNVTGLQATSLMSNYQSAGAYLTSQSNQALSAGNGSFTFQTASLADSNGVSWSTGTQGIYASVKTDYLTTQTTQASSVFMSGNTSLTSSGTYNAASMIMRADGLLSLAVSNNSFVLSAPASTAFQYVSNTSNVTANAMNTTERSNFVYSSAALNLTNISATLGSNAISLSVAAPGAGGGAAIKGSGTYSQNTGTVEFANSNGITFGLSNNGTMTASHNGITQQSTQPVAASASNGSFNFSTLKFVETNGVTWATSTDGIRASVATNYQSQGAYLTTAMVSDAGSRFLNVGTTNGTNASITLASNNLAISVNAQSVQPVAASASNGSFNFSTLKFVEGSGVTWATQAGGIQASVKTDYQSSNANYLTSQSNQAFSASGGSSAFQTLNFANSNGITFSNSNGSVIASHNGLTTAMASDAGSRFLNTGTTNGTNISITLASNNLALSVGNYITTARASNDGIGLNTALTANGVSVTANSSGLSLNFPAFLTTAMQSASSSVFAKTGFTSGSTVGSDLVGTHNTAGLSLGVPKWITTAMASNAGSDFVAATAAFNGTNASGTIASNGISISVNPGGGASPVASASNGSFSFTTLGFSNANNVTFGTSAGSIITASVAAPGAAAENNWVNLLGANTAGNTTASGSTIGISGINLTLSGTNNSVWNISAPATSSLSATGLVSLSTNGSTISIGVADKTLYQWQPYGLGLSSNTSIGVSSIYFCPINPQQNVSMGWVEQVWSNNVSTSATATWARSMTFNYGLYSLNGATISQISSSSVGMSMTASSNVSKAFTYGYSTNTVTFSTASSSHPAWDVAKIVRLPFNMSMSAGGQYFWAQQISTASSGANVAASWSQLFNNEVSQASYALLEWTATSASTRYNILEPYGFIRSATSAGLPSSMATTDASIYSNYQPYLLFEKHT